MKKILLSLFLLLIIFFPKNAFASEFFSTESNAIYTIQNTGRTNVRFNNSLINKSGDSYASSYTLVVGFKNLENIQASDGEGPIGVEKTENDRGTELKLRFNQRVVGKDQKLNFSISFDTFEVAQSQGRIWEVNIPGLSDSNDFDKFSSSVIVPQSLGSPVYIKPDIKRVATSSSNTVVFDKKDLGNSGISMAYGDYQVYRFNLRYQLENANLFPVRTEIALPPSTNYQNVSIDDILPKPTDVVVDRDGNWLAQFSLKSRERIEVNVLGNAQVYLNPKPQEVKSEDLSEYLKPTKYWQTNDPKIQRHAKELKTPEAIYNYTLKTLKYDFQRVKKGQVRLGALDALNKPDSAVCLEFSDLFIALSRAAGIPAREVNGFAYTANSSERPLSLIKDVLHAWPEYYDSKRRAWIMVDPTWGNTTNGVDYFKTLDFDHFAFVIRGIDSQYPIPAGGYKFAGNESVKNVEVSLERTYKKTPVNISLKPLFNKKYTAGLSIEGVVIVENNNGEMFDEGILTASSQILTPKKPFHLIENIPPFGKKEVVLSFNKTPFLTNRTDNIKISLGSKEDDVKIKVSPIFLNYYLILGGVLIGIFTITSIIVAKKLRRLHLSRQRE
ncbi:MAG: hypothetical protein A2186_03000 [Candidatus Levybacteria bacterium RIFOXYA1_FULL_41_10]|nr:MAG: Transglutaminase domain protein [Candidatus Levybacteria bacterium GW2011_GWA1_39_34]KKR49965.1 MAG: hypothetical protein UT87_C0022G0010 [Candidatus Levybacteria bacterium GW2011_GWC1_40_19]KKR94242.1 MAG: Transglutaminase domain protein [Candidatus Levybacteria bacterium GW2011_GWA2_41_15]KKS01244.1 MAG: Transglutaminase domain protein [Candidatus Levybacteria bacterium GW2011_GWB1_41_21]OGH21151.1 MAG: hypothetical protein A2695_00285 [Candidatus Levybacteria bacterium RIFCSPHIGHO2_0